MSGNDAAPPNQFHDAETGGPDSYTMRTRRSSRLLLSSANWRLVIENLRKGPRCGCIEGGVSGWSTKSGTLDGDREQSLAECQDAPNGDRLPIRQACAGCKITFQVEAPGRRRAVSHQTEG